MSSGHTDQERSGRNAPPRADEPDGNGTAVEAAKFDLGAAPRPFDGAEIPWAYGENRITAMARDPDSLYLYWEITDDGIADAQLRLGEAGQWAWCNLRVYNTTGRAFDGTNAHDYFDIGVGREERERFVMLDRPSTTFCVEIGMKSHEGYFQPIARSGPAECPRKGPSPNHHLDWMTVTTGETHPTARPYVSKYAGPPPGTYTVHPAPVTHAEHHRGGAWTREHTTTESRSWTWAHPSAIKVRWEGPWLFGEWHAEWRTHWLGEHFRTTYSVGPFETRTWSMGPFPLHLVDGDRLAVHFEGETPTFLVDALRGLEIFGPWMVVIRSFDGEPQRRVLGTWRVHWVTVSPTSIERWWTAIERRRIGAFRREVLTGFGSGAHAIVEAGASEIWRLGASERRWLGASEWFAFGGSEVLWIGASQLLFAGASALIGGVGSAWAGGSWFAGASETWMRGASETWLAGASEYRLGGGSESWSGLFGASEWLGASEHAFGKGN